MNCASLVWPNSGLPSVDRLAGARALAAAIGHHQAGRFRDAERIYWKILKQDPGNADTLNLLGVVTVQLGYPEIAVDHIGRALAVDGKNPTFHFNLGLAYQTMGDREQAIASYRRASELKPDYADALTNLGNLLLNAGATREAEDCYRAVARLEGANPVAHNNLGAALLRRNARTEAEACFREAVSLKPDYAEAHNGLGTALLAQDDCDAAVDCFRQALRIGPDVALVHNNLGLGLGGQGRFDEAVDGFREALRLRPDYSEANVNLGAMYFAQDRLEEAEECYRDALRLRPGDEKARMSLARVFVERDEFDAALEIYDAMLAEQPDAMAAKLGKAGALEKQGALDAAFAIVRPLADSGAADCGVAALFGRLSRRFDCRDEAVALLEDKLAAPDLAAEARRTLHFGLGELYDGLDRFDDAFRHYAKANALRPTPFDPARNAAAVDRLIAFFTGERVATLPRASNESRLPVFIVGMPRSGTSLVEQVLASHPAVHGVGELRRITRIAASLKQSAGPGADEPSYLAALGQDALDAAAAQHLDWLGEQGGEATRVSDKMPYNFRSLGLISRLFPRAAVIHCRRDPMDTCLSGYFQNFGRGNFQSFDLEHVGLYYVQYRRLMDHWREVLDIPILEVRYEDHVSDPERVCREMLAFLDLEWDPRCLAFHDSKRVVKTASRDQVRQPMYTRSAGRWRNYERHLGPLKAALAGLA